MKKKKHYCEECGKELTEYEYENFDGMCESCSKFMEE